MTPTPPLPAPVSDDVHGAMAAAFATIAGEPQVGMEAAHANYCAGRANRLISELERLGFVVTPLTLIKEYREAANDHREDCLALTDLSKEHSDLIVKIGLMEERLKNGSAQLLGLRHQIGILEIELEKRDARILELELTREGSRKILRSHTE